MNTGWRWCLRAGAISGTEHRNFTAAAEHFGYIRTVAGPARPTGGSMNRRGFLLGALILGTVGLVPRHLLAQDPQPQTPGNPCAPAGGRRGEGGGRGPREGGRGE